MIHATIVIHRWSLIMESHMIYVSVVASDGESHRHTIGAMLSAAAKDAGHPFEPQILDLAAHIDEIEAGGLSGQLTYGWFWIMLLAVEPEYRGYGVGKALVEKAEAFAREHNGLGVHVDTFAYQAPGFYERLGYQEVSRLPGPRVVEDRVYFVKRF